MEGTNRFKGLDLIECLNKYGQRFVKIIATNSRIGTYCRYSNCLYKNKFKKFNVFSFAHKQQSELKTPNCVFKYMCSVDVNHSIYLSKCDKEKV